MKRFLTTAVAMVAMTSTAHAGSLNLDMRLDYNSATYKDAGVPDTSKFYFKTGRLDYSGKATDDISFRARLAFNKSATTNIDAAQTAVELAYLTHKMSDNFSLTAGKFATDIGGFEGTTSGADLYATSTFYTPSGNATTVWGTKDLLYMTGAKLSGTFEGNAIHLMVLNETDTKAGPTNSQNSNMFGIVYKGSFMEKALNFIASHHMMAGATKDDKHAYSAVGVMWNSSPVMVSVDYLMGEYKTDATGFKDSVNSVVVKAAYTGMEGITPRLEFMNSEEKIGGATDKTNKYVTIGAVVEYKPYTDTNFRYHVAYNNTKATLDGVTKDAIKDEVVVGARLMADFLK